MRVLEYLCVGKVAVVCGRKVHVCVSILVCGEGVHVYASIRVCGEGCTYV